MIQPKINKPAKPALAVVRPVDHKKFYRAYSDLEGELRDLERMAILAAQLAQERNDWLNREQYEDLLLFAVLDVETRAAALRKQYDAGYDQGGVS